MNRTTVLRVSGLLVLAVVLLPFVVFAVPQLIGAQQSFVVASSSMSPTINAGDVVLVNDVSPQTIKRGDIVTFQEQAGGETSYVTHRVVKVVSQNDRPAFRTKGDANENVDPGVVPAQNLVGRVTLTIPYLGQAIAFAQTTLGRALLVGVPVTLLILGELWDLLRAYLADRQRTTSDDTSQPHLESESGLNGQPEPESKLKAKSTSQLGALFADEPVDMNLKETSNHSSVLGNQEEAADRLIETIQKSSDHLVVTDQPPTGLTEAQIIGELRDIERLSEAERREYKQRGHDIDDRERVLRQQIDERIGLLEEIHNQFN